MIEDLFPKTVSNILDYDAIKAAAKKYVEETFVQIVESFGNNMVLQYMDEEHLSEVAYHVSGDKNMTVEQLLDYINSENIYRECDFVGELFEAFPEGVEYKEFEVTGYGFPNGDVPPFDGTTRSFKKDGTPQFGQDSTWGYNAEGGYGERNLLMSRFKGQFPSGELPAEWKRKSGRRASWGNDETWMTTGGFGKPATIHINVDEERSVIEENGLSSVENWLGTVSNKLPINLYIEINTEFRTTNDEPSYTSKNSFVYSEEEIFCTNDPAYEVFPEHIEPPEPPHTVKYSYVVLDKDTGGILHSEIETGLQCVETSFVLLPDEPLLIIEPDPQMYDVWIETVDLANNVVIALRSVFTGLTATRANTIVNNAPTYLSRYNSYLNNQGGPYTQADAIAMRDQLQSKIPSGDTSTFGIRLV